MSWLIGTSILFLFVLLVLWYRTFRWSGEPDERYTALTSDGWTLELTRYRARGRARPYPILCSHGMAGSSLIFDLHPTCSLARYLASRGFDTWLVNLRGRAGSWPDGGSNRSLHWSFDDFVAHDFRTAVARVRELSGAKEVFWLGMEMSGQVLYAADILRFTDGVRGGVTFGLPALTPKTAQVPGVTSAPRSRRNGRVPFRGGASFAGPILAYTGSRILESSFRPCNTEPSVVARYFRNGVPDESTELVGQFSDWIDRGVMATRDGTVVYSDRLDQVKLPLLLLVGERDLQRPAEAVERTFAALGSSDKSIIRAGRAQGFSVDFGHDDLLAGRAAPWEIYPRVVAWLEGRSK